MDSVIPLAEREDHGHPKLEMSELSRPLRITKTRGSAGRLPSSFKFSDRQYLNILQSVGQSLHVIDPNDRIIYWNKSAEHLFGYSAEEALGQVSIKLVVDIRDYGAAYNVVHRVKQGERWTGMFPVKKKSGERFTIIVTNNPFHDDACRLIGGVCTMLGSYGAVYHGLWTGTDVAIKVFSKIEYTDDMLHSFRQEVSLMKVLRHPNILLFMGSVTSPEHLCIATEFLQRGSLFQLLHRNQSKLQWRRRVDMAIDIAAGMNYLHHCNPPIIHRDLKSSNLLVNENWAVKVGDFGLARPKHETFVIAKSGKGTPQWMAPESLRNEPSDEKSDVYSYGVILWELTTEKIPWDNLNTMQVIGVVGFMNQRLEIPKDVDRQWASIIESCWHSDPSCRPTFLELLERLRAL